MSGPCYREEAEAPRNNSKCKEGWKRGGRGGGGMWGGGDIKVAGNCSTIVLTGPLLPLPYFGPLSFSYSLPYFRPLPITFSVIFLLIVIILCLTLIIYHQFTNILISVLVVSITRLFILFVFIENSKIIINYEKQNDSFDGSYHISCFYSQPSTNFSTSYVCKYVSKFLLNKSHISEYGI